MKQITDYEVMATEQMLEIVRSLDAEEIERVLALLRVRLNLHGKLEFYDYYDYQGIIEAQLWAMRAMGYPANSIGLLAEQAEAVAERAAVLFDRESSRSFVLPVIPQAQFSIEDHLALLKITSLGFSPERVIDTVEVPNQAYFLLGISLGEDTATISVRNCAAYLAQFDSSPLTLAENLSIIALHGNALAKRQLQVGGSTSGPHMSPILFLKNDRVMISNESVNCDKRTRCIPHCLERIR